MSFRGPRPQDPWGWPGPQGEMHRRELCRQLGFPYPPNHEFVFRTMMMWKSDAERLLKVDRLMDSFHLYTSCVYSTELFLGSQLYLEERWKLFCNRSLVLTKLRRFVEAENDARQAVALNPDFVKGYWRIAQAVKGAKDGPAKALPSIMTGLQKALQGHGESSDVLTFLTELCTLLPQTSSPGFPYSLRTNLGMIVPEIGPDTWTKVLQKLSTTNAWQSVAMLISGKHRGPTSVLEGIARGISCTGVSVGSLLSKVTNENLRSWGEALAVELIRQGALVDEIGHKMSKPPVHVATEISLNTKQQLLLQCVLEHYKDSHEKKNAQDAEGSTALHVLVRSGQASTTHGLATLQLLLKHKLNPTIEDKIKKTALDYLGQEEKAFVILKKATKTVEELRQDLEILKACGTEALKAGKMDDALVLYGEALEISQQSKQLYKEAAILYSNRANIFYKLKQYTDALTNSLAAISCDNSYPKGHWWTGKIFIAIGENADAFQAYIDGCNKSSISSDVQLNFIMEAVVLLKQVSSEKFMKCYSQLPFIHADHWPQILGRLSTACEWKIIAYLILGCDIDKKELNMILDYERAMALCTGVARSASLRELQMKTVLKYLEDKPLKQCMPWLDALVTVLYLRGGPDVFSTLSQNDTDTALHALVRYSLLTGSFVLLREIPNFDQNDLDNLLHDGNGNSLYHTVAKMRPLPPEENMQTVIQLLLDKGYSAMERDMAGKLPVEYLDSSYPGSLFDLFFKASKEVKLNELNNLKTEGNTLFKMGLYPEAIDCYSQAISVLQTSSPHTVSQQFSTRDIAVLYGNRAEAFMKVEEHRLALEDAKKSVSVDGHWYKGHLRVGKALRGLHEIEMAMRAFINAYRDATDQESVKLEILMELCDICPQLTRSFDLKKRLPNFPSGEGHMWARAVHKLVLDKQWDIAQLAYNQYLVGSAKRPRFSLSLKPFCDLRKLKKYSWGVDLIQYFLESGADRQTISIERGDTYMHAVVRIDLVVGKSCKFVDYALRKFCGRGNKEHLSLDIHGNTVLHIAAKETGQDINVQQRHRLIILLLKHDLNPNSKNKDGKLAIDYLPQPETQSKETLRMAMYGKENMPKNTMTLPADPRVQRASEQSLPQLPRPKVPEGCDLCEQLLSVAIHDIAKEETLAGYTKLTVILAQPHKGTRHEKILGKAIDKFVDKLGESANPEIPNPLTDIRKDFYIQVIEGLASKGKWRQVDALVRKYRAMKGSDQLKGFAAGMTVVPVISDSSLKGTEDLKLQIVSNLLSSGATFGSDNGVRAIQCAQQEDHYKVVAKLIREGADMASMTMTPGDTPVHAALKIVLEKEKTLSLLEFLLDLHKEDAESYPHLDPEQLDDSGECLFHVLAKAKNTSIAVKVTEMLWKRNISGNYYNKDGKLPVHYITGKKDRRQQYFNNAINVKPSREQRYQKKSHQKEKTAADDEDLQQFTRPSDNSGILKQEMREVNRTLSEYETRKRKISELIRSLQKSNLPELVATEDIHEADTSEKDLDNVIDEDIEASCNKKPKLTSEKKEISSKSDIAEEINKSMNNNSDIESLKQMDSEKQVKIENKEDDTLSDVEEEEFIDAVESVEELSKHDLESIDDLPAETLDNDGSFPKDEIGKDTRDKVTIETCDNSKVGESVGSEDTHKTANEEQPAEETMELTAEETKDLTAEETKDQPAEVTINDPGIEAAKEQEEESESEDEIEEEELEKDFVIDAQVFDNLEWEVECTAEVWKTLRDKNVQHELKRRIVHKIQLLAVGDWQHHLCKKLKKVSPSLKLFEAKFSKGSRIIWELAIAFSPRLSEEAESRLQVGTSQQTHAVRGGRIYSEIIRVWDIVLDHDKIHRTVEKIKRSHDRGEKCIIQKNLKGIRDECTTMSFAERRYPRLYAEGEETLEELQRYKQEIQRYFPPASANDTEYHILKFYSFSSVLVSHILQNVEAKVDFPFRVTDLEHAIIHLRSKAPILLLGRSGTGKTTCCLYRLWSQFHSYWNSAKKAEAPLIPRCAEFLHQEVLQSESEDEESEGDSDDSSENDEESEEGASAAADPDNDDHLAEEADECDHLHQLFITKNSVLCSEVQKNFRELSHADELMVEHVQHEEENLPARFQDLHDYSFPLFLTSRQLLLMLDASIGPPHFFQRKDDGSLKVDIAGWSDMDGPLSILPLLDEDSDVEEDGEQFIEEEDDDDMDDAEARQGATGKKKKIDPRREITYAVFVEEIWPRIRKNLHYVYHPSLIWMEIMSFIKGSYEALSKRSGYLQKDEYETLGKKRAPNFSGQRDVIYRCFKRYDHFKKQNSLFDETDLVHDVFCRLQQIKTRSWVIHQVFVDETQDFTQAELCLMIRLCQNPNDMFLTGDTAQSIMRGIAFRFSDLRSLFYHAKKSMQAMGKTSAVEVPKQVYQLTHNYRSHAGILALASSILELMVQFFPESFDRLQPDQGLFNGPRPILLESCSFSDLAVLLRGNKRKTSHIEFGAHQAILVVNETARELIPEELRLGLVLTIYEAKGLEFDDVLLYNFFKDSQANKEWRVVTSYLEELALKRKESPAAENDDSLVIIDEEILAQSGRPRRLKFDANQHKVLNSELKHLYTALTRARVNVWIFDEDMERRAPMFEFFKVRKLVKSLTVSEINEESLSETVFAEKSSCVDWLRRGEDFMKHHLYQVAAKCFGMGLDKDRENVALAHHQALMASRLKEQPRRMREEFLVAAEMYLQCSKPTKAAVCLQNAREKELAAELHEKLGQFERAADIYRKLKQPIASSRCYEQLGNFNKAIEVLYENEEYVMAMDTLRRYNVIIQDFGHKRLPVPLHLLENKPAGFYKEENLSHRAAEMFHRNKHERSMLEAVDRFHNVDDQVQFLEKRGYITQAANCLKKHGQMEKAASLLLKFGRINESVYVAKETLKEAVIANHLLAACRILMSKKKAGLDQNHLQEMIKEAIQLFQTCRNSDGFGQTQLLQAELTGQVQCVREAWKAFSRSSPVRNEAGLIECANLLVARFSTLEDITVIQPIVQSIEHVFKLCQVLLASNPTPAAIERCKKLDHFYGIQPCSQDMLAIHPLEKPLCLEMMKEKFKSKTEKKRNYVEVRTKELREAMVIFLLRRCKDWIDPVSTALHAVRDRDRLCEYYQAGLDCPNMGNIDRPCFCLHKPMSLENLRRLILTDILFLEFELNVQEGSSLVSKQLPEFISNLTFKSFIEEGEMDLSKKFRACKLLWDDLMPAFGHSALIGNDTKGLVNHLRGSDKLLCQFRRYLEERWRDALKEQKRSGEEKRLKCNAVRETEVFLLFEFGYHLFGFDHGRRNIPRSPREEMTALENSLDQEVLSKGKWDYRRKKYFYTLMISEDYRSNKVFVECVARRFTDAYELITRTTPDPFDAVFKFNKFMLQLSMRKDVSFFPEMKSYLLWVEFYTVVAILIIAKLKSKDFPDFAFILPSSYLDLVKFIEATFPSYSYPILDSIEWWQPSFNIHNAAFKLQDRLKYYAFTVSGHTQGVQVMDEVLKWSLNDPTNYCLVERLLVLAMTMVCNIGKTVPVECEISLLGTMSRMKIPPEGPKRLAYVVKLIRESKGEADVANALNWLIQERKNGDETLLVNRWRSKTKHKIESSQLQDMSLFSAEFLNPKTFDNMHNTNSEPVEVSLDDAVTEPDLTEEEMQKGRADKQAEKAKQRAALVITRFVRKIGDWKRQSSGIAEIHRQSSESHQLFSHVKVTPKWCGFCGVNFEQKLEEGTKKQDTVWDSQSGPNEVPIFPLSPSDWPTPTSPEQTKQQPFKWGTAKTSAFDNPALKEKLLQSVRKNHEEGEDHERKKEEFDIFHNRYREEFAPKIEKFKAFLNNSDLNLTDKDYQEKNYDRHIVEIDKMISRCSLIEKDIQNLVAFRKWTVLSSIDQAIKEVDSDLRIVKPYVEEVQAKLKQEEEEKRLQASASASGQSLQNEAMEEEDDDIEEVVADPKMAPRNKKKRNRQWKKKRN